MEIFFKSSITVGSLKSNSHLNSCFIVSHSPPAAGCWKSNMHPWKSLVLKHHKHNALWMPRLIFLLRCLQLLHQLVKIMRWVSEIWFPWKIWVIHILTVSWFTSHVPHNTHRTPFRDSVFQIYLAYFQFSWKND